MRIPQRDVTPARKAATAAPAPAPQTHRPADPRAALLLLHRTYGNRRAGEAVRGTRAGGPVAVPPARSPGRGPVGTAQVPERKAAPGKERRGRGGPAPSEKGVAVFAGRAGLGGASPAGTRGGASSDAVARSSGQGAGARFSGGGFRAAERRARFTTTDAPAARGGNRRRGADGQAGAADDRVTFTSTDVSFTVPAGPIDGRLKPRTLALGVQGFKSQMGGGFTARGTVTAEGPADRVAGYTVGFVQTVFKSARKFYYSPSVPDSGNQRKLYTDFVPGVPVRDGAGEEGPWSNPGPRPYLEARFDRQSPSEKTTLTQDTPTTFANWTVGEGRDQQELVGTGGEDQFRTWLAVHNAGTGRTVLLDYVDWRIGYRTDIRYNDQDPSNSVVRPDRSSGARITKRGAGSGGGRRPRLDGRTANDVHEKRWTTWRWRW
ncbi:hypothetical protein [Streptomyces sp. NPDC047000]|uniref:hypothetical protein n=1 Tax=Streptomyces sp. NPDC047000 TaxID=3155474 RepID=UPI00340D33CF